MAESYKRKSKFNDDEHSQQLSATENVFRVRVLLGEFKPMMAASIQELRRAGLKIDCFGLNENNDRTTSLALLSTLTSHCLVQSQFSVMTFALP